MAKDLPINPRIVEQLAKATVRNIVDGIVELVTNSDDSYKRLEGESSPSKGEINIYVSRRKGGYCEKLIVEDFAEGMTEEELEKALEFAGETSGFEKGRTVRGFFGRGLKETIIALGEGEIQTIKDGKLTRTRLWHDKKLRKHQYDDEMIKNTQEISNEPNGTKITIQITNEKVKIPEYEKFKEQLSRHYALRDIMASDKRKVKLKFEDFKRKLTRETNISFSSPKGKKVKEEELILPRYGDKMKIVIYESEEPLDSPRYNPFGLAGILIKTKGAILDSQLFKFENELAARYFFGEAICDGLEKKLREGDTSIIDPNRAGLEWRHEYCQALAQAIESVLEPLISAKRRLLEKKPGKEIKESTQKMIRKLCSLLNEMAKRELEDIEEPVIEPEPDITNLQIKPEIANIQKDKPRTFSIYAPVEIIKSEGDNVTITSDTLAIKALAQNVKLTPHPKYSEKIWYRYFKVVGNADNAEGTITVTLGRETASAKVKVAPPRKRKGGRLMGRKGGFISDIKTDQSESPTQRTFYEKNTGIIKIFVKFPSVAKFIQSGLEGIENIENPEGRVLLAELVGEAFCRELARRKLESNPPAPGGEIDAFNNEMNIMQAKSLHLIQETILEWKSKE